MACKPTTSHMAQLPLPRIRADGGTNARAALDQAAIEEYSELLRTNAAEFPPIIVYRDHEGVYWLAGGFHRYEAHKRAGRKTILAEVRPGSLRDAILWAVGDNASHGIRRRREDKRRAVEILLHDDEWRKWSDSEVARRAAVSRTFVAMVRQELTCNVARCARKAEKNGTSYWMAMPKATIAKRPAELLAELPPAEQLLLRQRAEAGSGGHEGSRRASGATMEVVTCPRCAGTGQVRRRRAG